MIGLPRYLPLLWVAGVLLYVLSVTFHYVLLAEEASREAQERALEARILARDAELKALRAQVNPHFLFNCLHSISALTSVDAGKAREMCILLADFLRTTLRVGGQETITVEEELTLIRGYLAIEKVRFGAASKDWKSRSIAKQRGLLPASIVVATAGGKMRSGMASRICRRAE